MMKIIKMKLALIVTIAFSINAILACQTKIETTTNSTVPNSATPKLSEKATVETANAEKPKTEENSTESAKTKTLVVKFAKGKTSAEYENSIGKGETHIYVVNVKKGQYLGAQTYADDDVPFIVRKKGGAELEVPEGSVKWGGDVPESGDYEIVISKIKKTAKYSITVSAE